MTHPRKSFITRPVWYRAGYGALVSVGALGIPVLILVAIAAFGGRYQAYRRGPTEYDMWLAAAVYPLGLAIAGAITGVAASWIRRTWHAGVVGFGALLPAFALLSLTTNPRGASAYTVHWPLAVACALLLGVPAGVLIFRGPPRRAKKRGRGAGSKRHAV